MNYCNRKKPAGLSWLSCYSFFSIITAFPLAVTQITYGSYLVPPVIFTVSGSKVI